MNEDPKADLPLMKHWNKRKKKYPRVPILYRIRSSRPYKSETRKHFVQTYVLNTGDCIRSSGSIRHIVSTW